MGPTGRTWKQAERQRTRVAGRYSKINPCECCGKSAGVDYWSVSNPIDGIGLVLCAKCCEGWESDPETYRAKAKARAGEPI